MQDGFRKLSHNTIEENRALLEQAMQENPEVFTSGQETDEYLDDVDLFEDAENISDIQASEFLSRIEFQFFLLVWVPCWFEYEEYATQLYHNAKAGDSVSLEKLFELDKRVAVDPEIMKNFVKAAYENGREFGDYLKAFEKPPQKPDQPELLKKIKGWLGGFLLAVNQIVIQKIKSIEPQLGSIPQELMSLLQPLKYEEIRGLFNAHQKDLTGDHMAQDEDFRNDFDAAFKKRLQREVEFWKFIFPGDFDFPPKTQSIKSLGLDEPIFA